MTRPNIEHLDRLWEDAQDGEWVPTREKDAFCAALHNAYPELSAYVKSLEARIERTATRCRQEIHAHETSVEYADEFDALAANIARRVLSDLGETP